MATDIVLPRIGFAMTEAQITEWHVQDGQQVDEGQPLFTLEADKSASEVEAPASGALRIVKPAGAICQVGTVVGVIE